MLAFVDTEVGLDNTLIVLSADHGGPDTPGYLNSLGIPAGYVDPETWDREAAIGRIKSRFRPRPGIFHFVAPYSSRSMYRSR